MILKYLAHFPFLKKESKKNKNKDIKNNIFKKNYSYSLSSLSKSDYDEIMKNPANELLAKEEEMWNHIKSVRKSIRPYLTAIRREGTYRKNEYFDLYDEIEKKAKKFSISKKELEEAYWDLKPKVIAQKYVIPSVDIVISEYLENKFGSYSKNKINKKNKKNKYNKYNKLNPSFTRIKLKER